MLGVVILNYNDCVNACKLANQIKHYSNIWKICIVDNCSMDNSLEILKEEFKKDSKVYVEKSERNGGYAYGNNFGVRLIKDFGVDMALICNTDVEFSQELVQACIDSLNNGWAMVSGLMKNANGAKMYENNYRISRYIDDLKNCFFIGRLVGRRKHQEEYALDIHNHVIKAVDLLPGSLFAVRVEDFDEIGGLDENTFLYCEERILGRRMHNADKKVGLMLYVDYLHFGSTSINQSYKVVYEKMKLLYKSRLYYQRVYNHVWGVKYSVLRLAMILSLMEFRLCDFVRTFIGAVSRSNS